MNFPGPASHCINYERLFTTKKEKQDLLHKINSRRNKVASGEIRSLSAAVNMVKLEWNKELEISAQRWADQCVKSTLYNNTDTCRDLEYTSVGQNVATIYGEAPGLTATSMIDLWYMELLNVNVSILSRYLPSSVTGMQHYEYFTQLVWGNTVQVGCAGVKFKEINIDLNSYQNRTVHRLVCNFAPMGNRLDEPVYNFGVPCSMCTFGSSKCDSEFTFLCSSRMSSTPIEIINSDEITTDPSILDKIISSNNFEGVPHLSKNNYLGVKKNEEHTSITSEVIENYDTQFDFFSDLFDITMSPVPRKEQTTTKCREVLAVDEFIELLRSRLRSDHLLRELLLSTTKLSTSEPVVSDKTVAAIIKQLYSKKEAPITTKSTESDSLNSTILADLVEAVIFRHSEKYSTTENAKLITQVISDVRPVKIQAELGEVKSNKEFTGNYFFPEVEVQTEQETDDSYDEQLPTSEISLEIEDLKRKSGTIDFLEEVLESDIITDDIKGDIMLPTVNIPNELKRYKRKAYSGLFINYMDLLKKLATDLRNLKLQEKYHCVYSCTQQIVPNICLIGLVSNVCFL
ncbi:uncharacterized protein LOC123655137 [Melitaea cinxia]|uniref:uncharacterized protein LOC123655137 n=1 Tax=Melitaea cinxia TaxID=113334 RepID=UPI001E26ECCD|nr:uncharacterized protein LOC123655137 [Melitaea cinxia]